MTTPAHPDHEIDRYARRLHAEAVARVPARTLAQLRVRRAVSTNGTTRPARPSFGWALAAAGAAVLAIAIGLSPAVRAPGDAQPDRIAAAPDANGNAYDEAVATLEEDPDFYLWLGTTDVQPLAME
ncbi:hypothetical protein [Luteimonas vadosa]|uniref:DUF3619 family protein n=1 Tax=Luteimonas vadosa TaxID=1165507 RepID=A0ABP9E9P8_9GAMM